MSGLVRTAFSTAVRRPCKVHGVVARRGVVIHAPGPESSPIIEQNAGGGYSAASAPNSSISQPSTSSSTSISASSFSSQHPYALVEGVFDKTGESSSVGETLPAAPIVPVPLAQHPFDTHAFVTYLEKSELSPKAAGTLMESTRQMIVERSGKTKQTMLHKEDMENAAYLFKAALSELRTELSVRARNDGLALRTMSGAIRREVDALQQKLKEDIATLKHDIEMDMNNRKGETRTEQKSYDILIEEINNKFTISLGDLRTEIESAKWDATRRAISIILLLVVFVVAITSFSDITDAKKAVPPPPLPPAVSRPVMRDVAVGNDDDLVDDDEADESDLTLAARSVIGGQQTGEGMMGGRHGRI